MTTLTVYCPVATGFRSELEAWCDRLGLDLYVVNLSFTTLEDLVGDSYLIGKLEQVRQDNPRLLVLADEYDSPSKEIREAWDELATRLDLVVLRRNLVSRPNVMEVEAP